MTDKEKQRLRDVIIKWAYAHLDDFSRHIYSTNPMIKYNKESDSIDSDLEVIFSIIDSVQTDGDE